MWHLHLMLKHLPLLILVSCIMSSCGNINVKTMQECNYDTKDLQKCGIAIKKDYSNYLSDAHMVKMKQEKLQLKDKIAKLKEV